MLGSRPISVHIDQPVAGGVHGGFKTPGRGLLQNRLGENATARKLISQTPFKQVILQNPSTSHHPGKAGGASHAGEKTAPRTAVRLTLGDKTPFPNRTKNRSSVGGGGVQEQLNFAPIGTDKPVPLDTPGLRPSSSRKSVRRTSHGPGGFNLTGMQGLDFSTFQTPRVNGNPWDVEDIDVVAPGTEETIQEEPVEDYDEIEYMPPKVEELPWEPPIELPDYKELGHLLANYSRMTWDDEEVPQINWDEPSLVPMETIPIGLDLPELEPFSFLTPPPSPPPVPRVAHKAPQVPISRTRSATVSAKTPAAPARRPAAQAPLAAKAATVSRAPSRNLAVPTAGSSGSLTLGAASRPMTRSRSALAMTSTTKSLAPTARKPSAPKPDTLKLMQRDLTTSRSAAMSRTSSTRPTPPPTTRTLASMPKRPATVASARRPTSRATTDPKRPPLPTAFTSAAVPPKIAVQDELVDEFDWLIQEKGLDQLEEAFLFSASDMEDEGGQDQ